MLIRLQNFKSSIESIRLINKFLFFLVLGICSITLLKAQNATKKKVAVYVAGTEGKTLVASKLTMAITRSAEYINIERTNDFLNAINTELKKRNNQQLTNQEIIKIGKKFGAELVCVGTVFKESAGYLVSLKLVNVQTANNEKSTKKYTETIDIKSLDNLMNKICQDFFGLGSATKNASSHLTNPNTLTFTVGGVSFEMVRVEGGNFLMGCSGKQGSDCYDDERPAHKVSLSTFYIGKFEVTQKLWKAVMNYNPSSVKGCDNCPVENVNWSDCQDFVRELSRLTGKQFRLPTEAEWEFAARGGKYSNSTKYAGSHSVSNVAWYIENSGNRTHKVGTKLANELGIYDMSGNVWEWCSDWKGTYNSSLETDPIGNSWGDDRVLRGGSWASSARYCRISNRYGSPPTRRYNFIGLRLCFVLK